MERRTFVAVMASGAALAAGAALVSRLGQHVDAPAPEIVAGARDAGTSPVEQDGAHAPANQALRDAYPEISKDLPEYFDYLQIPDATLDAYLGDLKRHGLAPRPGKAREQFLLSTDFFARGADESRPLGYVTLYDPYRSPCYNPFAAG